MGPATLKGIKTFKVIKATKRMIRRNQLFLGKVRDYLTLLFPPLIYKCQQTLVKDRKFTIMKILMTNGDSVYFQTRECSRPSLKLKHCCYRNSNETIEKRYCLTMERQHVHNFFVLLGNIFFPKNINFIYSDDYTVIDMQSFCNAFN